MCSINFVREFGLMMEEARKEYLGCRERMLWIALFYIANDRAKYNPQTQTYEWPAEFFQVSHQELDLYCKLNKKAVLELRNHLKQKGYIDFTKGERNAEKPMYKLNYLSLRDFGGENGTKEGTNMYPNNTHKEGPNMYPNSIHKEGPLYYKYKQGININPDAENTHREQPPGEPFSRARGGGYIGLDGMEHPARYDTAWKTSLRARGAVTQRIIDGCGNLQISGGNVYDYILEYLGYGMPPELIEDIAREAQSNSHFLAMLLANAQKFDLLKDA